MNKNKRAYYRLAPVSVGIVNSFSSNSRVGSVGTSCYERELLAIIFTNFVETALTLERADVQKLTKSK